MLCISPTGPGKVNIFAGIFKNLILVNARNDKTAHS